MTRTIAALLAAATIAGVAAPAAAQTKYFARERLIGTPTSMSAWIAGSWQNSGGCMKQVNGTGLQNQTRTVNCSSGSCDTTNKPVAAQQIACVPSGPKTTCNALVPIGSITGYRAFAPASNKPMATLEDAKALCEKDGIMVKDGLCYVEGSASNYMVYVTEGGRLDYSSPQRWYGSTCTFS